MFKHFACILALAASLPAAAESRRVTYADLNLDTPAGVARVQQRIDSAAKSVCSGAGARIAIPGAAAKNHACVKSAREAALNQLPATRVAIVRH